MSKSSLFNKVASEAKEKVDKRIEKKTSIKKKTTIKKPIVVSEEQTKKQSIMTFTLNPELEEDFLLYTNFMRINRSKLIREFLSEYLEDKSDIIEKLKKLKK